MKIESTSYFEVNLSLSPRSAMDSVLDSQVWGPELASRQSQLSERKNLTTYLSRRISQL